MTKRVANGLSAIIGKAKGKKSHHGYGGIR